MRLWLAVGLLLALAAGAGCLGQAAVTVPALTNGTVAVYSFGGTPGGYGWGTGMAMVDERGDRLFPTSTGGGSLVVRVVGAVAVLTPTGLIESGSEFRLEYVDQNGNRTFVGKQAFVPGKGVVGDVSDGWQSTPAGPGLVWVHAWRLRGPDFLLATSIAGKAHREGTLGIPIPHLGETEPFQLDIGGGVVHVRHDFPEGGSFRATWTSSCPLPATLQHRGPDQKLVTALKLEACTRGAGDAVGSAAASTDVSLQSLAKPIRPAQAPWFTGSATEGPDAATAWSALTRSVDHSAACPDGCDLYAATKSEATKEIAGLVPGLTTTQHVFQWGFVVWDGMAGHRWIVEFRSDGPVVLDGGAVALDRPRQTFGIGEEADAAIARVASSLGPTVVRYALQEPRTDRWFLSLAPGELDQAAPGTQAAGLLAWHGPDGRLSSFAWTTPDL